MVTDTAIPALELLLSDARHAVANRIRNVQAETRRQFFQHLHLGRREANINPLDCHEASIKAQSCVYLAHINVQMAQKRAKSNPLNHSNVVASGPQSTLRGSMIASSKNKERDGFASDFDSLVDKGQTGAEPINMGLLEVVARPFDPFTLDLKLDHTIDHVDCPACKGANAAFIVTSEDLADMNFTDAAGFWKLYREQSPVLRERTHETTEGYLDALKKFFGKIILRDITPGHLRGYQIARIHNALRVNGQEIHPWKRKAGNSIINHELSVVGQMLTFAKLWHRCKPYYFPLPQKSWSPREVLSEEDEEQLWRTAAKHPEAALAYWCATITNNTTASGIELRGLRLKHIFMTSQIAEIYIPEDSVKNDSRPRRISLNGPARWAVSECLKRAIKLGACEPDHFLFPFRVKRNLYDPTRPPSRWFLRKSWEKLRAATGFLELNPHDLRHQCITKMLENGVNPETVIAIAGHVGRKMMEYYAHQRCQVKYAAVLTLETKKKPAAHKAATGTHNR
jgi:integrase